MPHKCCVPGCRSVYKGEEAVSAFKFPSDENMKDIWLRNINRDTFTPTQHKVVCIKHFSPDSVIREEVFARKDGSFMVKPKQKIKLEPTACPTIFNDSHETRRKVCSVRLKKLEPIKAGTQHPTRAPNKQQSNNKRKKVSNDNDELATIYIFNEEQLEEQLQTADNIKDFEEFRIKILEKEEHIKPFKLLEKKSFILIYQIGDCNFVPKISISVKVLLSLTVEISYENISLPLRYYQRYLSGGNLLHKWSKFDGLLKFLDGIKKDSLGYKKVRLTSLIEEYSKLNSKKSSEEKEKRLRFLHMQVEAFALS